MEATHNRQCRWVCVMAAVPISRNISLQVFLRELCSSESSLRRNPFDRRRDRVQQSVHGAAQGSSICVVIIVANCRA